MTAPALPAHLTAAIDRYGAAATAVARINSYPVQRRVAVSAQYDAARAALEAAIAQLLNGEAAVKVRPLVWDYREQEFGTYRADVYWVNQSWGSDSYYFATIRQSDGATLYDGDDLPTAKAAAQADYEARIMSALEVSP